MQKSIFVLPRIAVLTAAVSGILGATVLPGAAFSATHTVTTMTITSGTFFMSDGISTTPVAYNFFGPSTDMVSGYLGAPGGSGIASSIQQPNSIVGFPFFGAPVNIYTAANNLGDEGSLAGSIPGGPVPNGTVDDATGVLSMDLSSWFATWNGTDFNQGNAAAATNFNPVTLSVPPCNAVTNPVTDTPGSVSCNGTSCTFSGLEWNSCIVGGAFDGKIGTWILNGTLTIMPGFTSAGDIIASPAGGLVTSEAGETDSFTIRLSTAPASDVTIPLASSDLTEGTVSPASLTFTPGNFNTPQSVTVTGVDDSDQDNNVNYNVDIGPSTSADLSWNNRTFNSVGVTNEDDDSASTQTITTDVSDGFFGCSISDSHVRPWQRADLGVLGIGMLLLAAWRRRLLAKV
jgi:hypothetical protein